MSSNLTAWADVSAQIKCRHPTFRSDILAMSESSKEKSQILQKKFIQ